MRFNAVYQEVHGHEILYGSLVLKQQFTYCFIFGWFYGDTVLATVKLVWHAQGISTPKMMNQSLIYDHQEKSLETW